jgi:hypothetical protein
MVLEGKISSITNSHLGQWHMLHLVYIKRMHVCPLIKCDYNTNKSVNLLQLSYTFNANEIKVLIVFAHVVHFQGSSKSKSHILYKMRNSFLGICCASILSSFTFRIDGNKTTRLMKQYAWKMTRFMRWTLIVFCVKFDSLLFGILLQLGNMHMRY